MTKKKQISIQTIVDAIEENFDCWTQYLNTETGEVVALPDANTIPWDEDTEQLAEEIDASGCYEALPNQYEVNEYRIMEEFAAAIPNSNHSRKLFYALNGRRPFRHFKDQIIALGIDEDYYAFRRLEYVKIAMEWCSDHDIPFSA